MKVKIDTREKFTVVTPLKPEFTDIIAAEIAETCGSQLQKEVKNVILNLRSVSKMEENAAITLTALQRSFYENHASFVICSLQAPVEETLNKLKILEALNITPSESEAWDIVQMEEIERELLDGDDMEFGTHE